VLLARQVGCRTGGGVELSATRLDDHELLELVELEVRELLSSYQFLGTGAGGEVVAFGALKGSEVGKRDRRAQKAVDVHPQPARDLDKRFLMRLKISFSISGRGTVGDGRIDRGKTRWGGSRDRRLPGHAQDGGDGQEMFKKSLDEDWRAQRGCAAWNWLRMTWERGMVHRQPGSITPPRSSRPRSYILTKEEGGRHTPFLRATGRSFFYSHDGRDGVADLPAGTEMVMPGTTWRWRLSCITPVPWTRALRFAIREGGTRWAGTISEVISKGSSRLATVLL